MDTIFVVKSTTHEHVTSRQIGVTNLSYKREGTLNVKHFTYPSHITV